MTLYEFKSLEIAEQASAIWDGTFLELREGNVFRVLLYDLGGFYVEVFYSPGDNKIVKFRAFKSTNPLQPYLDTIKSDEINKSFE